MFDIIFFSEVLILKAIGRAKTNNLCKNSIYIHRVIKVAFKNSRNFIMHFVYRLQGFQNLMPIKGYLTKYSRKNTIQLEKKKVLNV